MSETNGHGPAAPPQLLKLLAKHERIVDSIRETLNALGVHRTRSASTRASQTLSAALALDEQRVAGRGRKKKQSRTLSDIAQRRQHSRVILERFNRDTPIAPPPDVTGRNRTIGSLVRYGYLKPKGDGFVRTAKEFHEKKA
jgi:hypothetical protein